MTVHDRWFITPPAEATDDEGNITGHRFPKYSDHDDVAGFAGNTFDTTIIEDAGYAGLIAQYDYEEWYIARFYGEDTPGYSALNEIHNHADTRTLADHASDVAPIMDERFGVDSWNFEVNV